MTKSIKEVATNVATVKEYAPIEVNSQYNWDSVIKVLTHDYTPDIVCEILRKCHFTYSTYIIADAENAEKEEVGEQLLLVQDLYEAVADMYKELTEDEAKEEN